MPSSDTPTSDVPAAGRTLPGFLRGSIRRVVIPVVLLPAIILPSLNVLRAASLPDIAYTLCQTHIIKSDDAPSDLVFFGSSRTGAGIDVEAVADAFTTGALTTAEKVAYTEGNELDRNLAYRTYAKHRGVPEVVAIELSFERKSERVEDLGTMLRPTTRTATLFETSVYQQMLWSLRQHGGGGVVDTFVKSSYQSSPSYFFDRLGIGADQALRSPGQAISPTDECTWDYKPRPGRWVVGNSEPYVEANAKKPKQKKQDAWTAEVQGYRPLDFDDPFTQEEMLLVEDLVDKVLDDGAHAVILYYLPSFNELPSAIDLEELQRRFPEAIIFDGREVLWDEARPKLRMQHYDENHLNRFAAHEISVALAAAAEEAAQ